MTPITHPVALDDQTRAAESELTALMQDAAETERMNVSVHTASAWLSDRAAQHMTTVTECPHLDLGPRPMFTALWAPGIVVCAECLYRLDQDGDGHCDRCGDQADEVVMTAVQVGNLLLLYALCDPCAVLDEAEHESGS